MFEIKFFIVIIDSFDMEYELFKRITTQATVSEITNSVERNLSNIGSVTRGFGQAQYDWRLGENTLHVSSINGTFGAINNTNHAVVEIKEDEGGKLVVAHVTYKPSIWFWILLIILLFTTFGWLIPIAFYLYHKKSVRNSLVESFDNVHNEFNMHISPLPNPNSSVSQDNSFGRDNLAQLKDAKELLDSGAITDDEFTEMKKKLL